MGFLSNGNKMFLLFFFTTTLFTSCKNNDIDFYSYQTFSINGMPYAVIEIPAGTNKKIEYNAIKKSFDIDKENGKNRVINFLPYLGNYGFIPSTYSNPEEGGDGDALDVLVLSESLKTGAIVEIIPIGLLKLIDDGEIDHKIIAIPSDKVQQIITVKDHVELSKKYPVIKTIIEQWFLNYNTNDSSIIEGWGDEMDALEVINKNLKQ